jgi:hypothetical protein
MASKYAALDDAILAELRNGPREFSSINWQMNYHAGEVSRLYLNRRDSQGFRITDSRLQSLRKRGLIESKRGRWHIVEQANG